ncbi:MAG: hypothetical protein IMW93_06600 [Thermoanaerobacteraceae bacterium]|uniref:Uncharacterized protein n=1 Tax=Desulfofundulus thermobenzoicus TaxID=29376 RepID=A0A6N7ILY8_9FIRM|nr:hypothetical protein [Desulfofundulus thermobenzoicus]MBE3588209.1 hypothetical protein [Thermoanaerobacteraceae bacterium]MQL50961.1 hypothetical protein [Desulfofundulus thermobenzoicus]HHW42869.1 hypothetical protein [Desulfotomaculum sp.]
MAFEVYKPRGERAEKAPMVSFSKSSIVLNNVAREKLGVQHVELAYDRDSNMVRIRGVDEGGMQIKKTKVFGKGFFKHFNITPRGKYEARFDDEERALYVKLNGVMDR